MLGSDGESNSGSVTVLKLYGHTTRGENAPELFLEEEKPAIFSD
jgi:hypothetical protein